MNKIEPKEWTQEEKDLVIRHRENGLTFKEISELLVEMGFHYRTPKSVEGIYRRYASKLLKDSIDDILSSDEDDDSYDPDVNMYSCGIKNINNLSDEILRNSFPRNDRVGKINQNGRIKIVSLSDLHIPFQNDNVISHMLKYHSDANTLVLNGDFLEVYSVSSWPKNKAILLREEYEKGLKILKRLASIYPRVILTRGNHEDRLQRYFSAHVDPNVSFMTDPDILHRMSRGYDFDDNEDLVKTHNLDNIIYNKSAVSWFVQIGKCIFAHPSSSTSGPMKNAINAYDYFKSRDYDFDAIVCAHSHKMGKIIYNQKLLIEQGCACMPLEYEKTSKMSYKPQCSGYAVVYLDNNGNVDFNNSNAIFCSTEYSYDPKNKFEIV